MREYAKIHTNFWISKTGKKIKELGIVEQLLSIYLMSCPHTAMLGIYYLPLHIISHETGIPRRKASKGVEALCKIGFCVYDEPSEFIWVCEMAASQISEKPLKPNDNRVKNIQQLYESLPNLPFLKDFYNRYHSQFHMKNLRENSSSFKCDSKPLLSQEKEQDQEKEQEQEQKYGGVPSPKKPLPYTSTQDASAKANNLVEQLTSSSDDPPSIAIAHVITMTLNDKAEFPISQQRVDEWQSLYPAVDVIQTLRNIRAWSLANPSRRKTRNGILRHINQWLAKEQNQGGNLRSKNNFSPHTNHINEHNAAVARRWLNKSENIEQHPDDTTIPSNNLLLEDHS